MPEKSDPLADPIDELRRIAARRRRFHRAFLFLAFCSVPLCAWLLWKPPLLLVWNASASVPLGLYRVQPLAVLKRGDLAVAWAPGPARRLAASRGYLPATVPLVKRVAAVAGDRVCARARSVTINGMPAATRGRSDGAGRSLPWWNGCRVLEPGEQFLLGGNPASFDGRYFGASRDGDIIGRAVLVWAR